MEILQKTIRDEKQHFTISVHVPDIFLEHIGIKIGDKVRIKASDRGIFCLEKSPDNLGLLITKKRGLIIPERMRNKYRITNEHKAQFFLHKGRVCFQFRKEVN